MFSQLFDKINRRGHVYVDTGREFGLYLVTVLHVCHVQKQYWTWWRHQMETFSTLLTLCEGSPPVTGGLPSQRPTTRSFGVFFYLCLNKRLSKTIKTLVIWDAIVLIMTLQQCYLLFIWFLQRCSAQWWFRLSYWGLCLVIWFHRRNLAKFRGTSTVSTIPHEVSL